MLTIDGSRGEGGGQILRSALALSLITGTAFRIENVRAGRERPGLLRQHLAAVRAAAEVGGAEVTGDALGSSELTFRPGTVRGGEYRFAVGSAGSACLVVQTVLFPLLRASDPSVLALEGGTHNPAAPTWDYLARVFFPLLARMGAPVETHFGGHGFYPAGGGHFSVSLAPAAHLAPLELVVRGEQRAMRARALVANLRPGVGERELAVLRANLSGLADSELVEAKASPGPGNALSVELEYAHVTEVLTSFGERGVRAEIVAQRLATDVRRYLLSDAPVGIHLADQLLVPLALAGGGVFRTLPLTPHSETNIDIVQRFLPVEVRCRKEETGAAVRVEVHAR